LIHKLRFQFTALKCALAPSLRWSAQARATIADAWVENTVGVTEIILVFPSSPKNLLKIIWVLFAETKRFRARPTFGYPAVLYCPDRSLHFRFRHSGGRELRYNIKLANTLTKERAKGEARI
jgi:hypothetical protein